MSHETPVITGPFTDAIPSDLAADTQAIIDKLMTGKPLAPETYQRIRDGPTKSVTRSPERTGFSTSASRRSAARDGE